ncbi:hypothetical protein ACQEUU_00150 [Nonomuraea sp. CA-218870]|uniref:DUF4190 domain-containing protein n=1 Tax=Nonomuraea sp. CA-218870 TaxID=3239998 RepID=UPI003D8EBE5F
MGPAEPHHPDLPESPETPPPAQVAGEGDADQTAVFKPPAQGEEGRAYPTPGGTPAYPGWEGTPEGQAAPGGTRPPSRYEEPSAAGPSPHEEPGASEETRSFRVRPAGEAQTYGEHRAQPEEGTQPYGTHRVQPGEDTSTYGEDWMPPESAAARDSGPSGEHREEGGREEPYGGWPGEGGTPSGFGPSGGQGVSGPSAFGGPSPYGGTGSGTPSYGRPESGTSPYGGPESAASPHGGPESGRPEGGRPESGRPEGERPEGGALPYGDQGPVPGTSPSSPYGGPPGGGAPYGGYPGGWQAARPGSGLATASLVLGVASPFLVFVCFTGLLTAILSIVFGIVALVRRVGKGRAITGIAFSVLAFLLFGAAAIWFWTVVQDCGQLPGELADRCFEERIPWMRGPAR